ncbi:uncharacterized protein BO88DRAFT_344929, partial [Aspergillus vadensis CBS 113365]
RLLKHSTSISVDPPSLLIQRLLFELSDNGEEQLVRNAGYGYASGFLYSTGKQLMTNTPARNHEREVNPLTSQRRDMETQSDLPEMTTEEKEREAERLFVLSEQFHENGVMQVENPVAVAIRGDRLEDI